MYSQELKEKVLYMLRNYSVREIAKETGVSITTIYKWRSELSKIEISEYEKPMLLKNERVKTTFCIIRTDLTLNRVGLSDIELLNSIQDEIDEDIYKYVLAAIYERLNLRKNSISLLKTTSNCDSKRVKEIIRKLTEKQRYYDICKWDELICWKRSMDLSDYMLEPSEDKVQPKTKKIVLTKKG